VGAGGTQWVEVREAATPLPKHRQPPNIKNYLVPNVNSAEAEESWLTEDPANLPREPTFFFFPFGKSFWRSFIKRASHFSTWGQHSAKFKEEKFFPLMFILLFLLNALF
jgi:hypothetical protein